MGSVDKILRHCVSAICVASLSTLALCLTIGAGSSNQLLLFKEKVSSTNYQTSCHRNLTSKTATFTNTNRLQRIRQHAYRPSSPLSSYIVQPRRLFFITSDTQSSNATNTPNNNSITNNNEEITPRCVITHYLSNFTPREEANLEDRILDTFYNILDLILNMDINEEQTPRCGITHYLSNLSPRDNCYHRLYIC